MYVRTYMYPYRILHIALISASETHFAHQINMHAQACYISYMNKHDLIQLFVTITL